MNGIEDFMSKNIVAITAHMNRTTTQTRRIIMKQVFYFNFLCNSSGEFGSTSGFSPSSFVAPSSASVAASSPFFVPLSVDLFDFADGLGVSSLGVLLDFYDLFDF